MVANIILPPRQLVEYLSEVDNRIYFIERAPQEAAEPAGLHGMDRRNGAAQTRKRSISALRFSANWDSSAALVFTWPLLPAISWAA